MKPVSLCLVQMGNKGLELVKSHPDVLPKEILQEITYKSMPMGAKPGDFSSADIGDVFYSSYVFSLPQSVEGERENIGSIIAVYSSMNYDAAGIRRVFATIVNKLQNTAFLRMETLEEILPNLYTGFTKGEINIKISSVVTISINFQDQDDEVKDNTNDFADEMWK